MIASLELGSDAHKMQMRTAFRVQHVVEKKTRNQMQQTHKRDRARVIKINFPRIFFTVDEIASWKFNAMRNDALGIENEDL